MDTNVSFLPILSTVSIASYGHVDMSHLTVSEKHGFLLCPSNVHDREALFDTIVVRTTFL